MVALLPVPAPRSAHSADFEFGRYLANECLTCHRPGVGAVIPDIFGRDSEALTRALQAYRDKQLPNPVMQNVAGRLKDDEIAALALYFSTAKP